MSSIEDAFGALIKATVEKAETAAEDPANTPAALRGAFKSYTTRHIFQPGDLVQWKPGMANRLNPCDGRPAIVMEVLTEPVLNPEESSGIPYFRELLNIKLGFLSRDSTLLVLHYDAARFEPYTGTAE